MDDPTERFRRSAAEYLALARTTADQRIRAVLTFMAQRLLDRADRGRPAQPGQQQQQPQPPPTKDGPTK
jgi:hypothetical protein